MSDTALVDTNILVYAYDRTDPSKHRRAIELIETLSSEDRLVVTTHFTEDFQHNREVGGVRFVNPFA